MIKQSYLKSAYAIEVVFLWLVNFLDFCFGRLGQSFPEGIIKPYDGTSLTIGNRPIAVVQSVTVFRLILATWVKMDLGPETENYHIANFVVSGDESLASKLRL